MSEVETEVVETGPKMSKKVEGVERDALITVLATENPKREGSAAADRFSKYFDLTSESTVQDAIDLGLTMGDIKYDTIHGNIEVAGAEVLEYEITPRGPRAESDEVEEPEVEGAEATEADGF